MASSTPARAATTAIDTTAMAAPRCASSRFRRPLAVTGYAPAARHATTATSSPATVARATARASSPAGDVRYLDVAASRCAGTGSRPVARHATTATPTTAMA